MSRPLLVAVLTVLLIAPARSAPPPWAGPPPRGAQSALTTYHYRGQGDGGTLVVDVTTVGAGQVEVHAEVNGHFCAGSFDGAGSVQPDRVVASGDQNAPGCRLTLVQTGNRMSVRPNASCSMLSGASCGFEGSVTQVR